jgi:hypothetical protein
MYLACTVASIEASPLRHAQSKHHEARAAIFAHERAAVTLVIPDILL